ncbi:hypothetical protein RhiirA5_433250 [Rhizophagus irregularis]|uniref:Uncharacterized protein n=1 Tax=Rhizophagus irregularis TaxID=588596 RepID=A0A2I1FFZ4_9GLOM|nr:hypothetical protein RhiirA5_433250 [Rhizophagus irregularis]PKY33314.1 hypothetical protein RhiirB3_452104 [Rhizophagus irregularis]
MVAYTIIRQGGDFQVHKLTDDGTQSECEIYGFDYLEEKFFDNVEEIQGQVIPDEDLLDLLKKKIYKLFISECSSIKCLSLDMISDSICKYPGSNISLSNLYDFGITEDSFIFSFSNDGIENYILSRNIHLKETGIKQA